jgi:predicted transcriptional regulator
VQLGKELTKWYFLNLNIEIFRLINMEINYENAWGTKGATLSDKSAREEYGLTQVEIRLAINNGELHFRINYSFDNPYFKLIRAEVEKVVLEKYGKDYLKLSKLKTELLQVNKELRKLKSQAKKLENRKIELQTIIDGFTPNKMDELNKMIDSVEDDAKNKRM